MRALAVLTTLILGVSIAACDGGAADPQSVETCEGLVPVGRRLVEDYLARLSDLPIEVVTGQAAVPPELVELTDRGRELDRRAAGLGCDVADLNAAIAAELGDIEPEDEVGALFLEIVKAGVVGTLPPPPAETTTTGG